MDFAASAGSLQLVTESWAGQLYPLVLKEKKGLTPLVFAEDTALARIEQQLRVLLGCETPARKVWGMLWSPLLPS